MPAADIPRPASERVPHSAERFFVVVIGYFSFLLCLASCGVEIYRAAAVIQNWKSYHGRYATYTENPSDPFVLAGFVPDTDQPLDRSIGGSWKAFEGAYVWNPAYHLMCAIVLFPIALSELPNSTTWHSTLRRGSCLQFLGRPNTTFHMGLLQVFVAISSWGRRPSDSWSMYITGYLLFTIGALNTFVFTPLYRDQVWTIRKQYKPEKEEKKDKPAEDKPFAGNAYGGLGYGMGSSSNTNGPLDIQNRPAQVSKYPRFMSAWEEFYRQVLFIGTTNTMTGDVVIQISANKAKKALAKLDKEAKNIESLIDDISRQGYNEEGKQYTYEDWRKENNDTKGPEPVELSNGKIYDGEERDKPTSSFGSGLGGFGSGLKFGSTF